jgi:hypothetical protein
MHPLRPAVLNCFLTRTRRWLRSPASPRQVRENRKPVAGDNPFIAMQEQFSNQVVAGLEAWREASEKIA